MKGGIIRANAVRRARFVSKVAGRAAIWCGQIRRLILGTPPGNVRKRHFDFLKCDQGFEFLKVVGVFGAFRFAEKQSG
jgi:hypothetical protein